MNTTMIASVFKDHGTDDDLDIATLVKMTLQRQTKTYVVITDPLSALKHFRINHMTYSLVISDIRMPIMNGFEFVRQLKLKTRNKDTIHDCI